MRVTASRLKVLVCAEIALAIGSVAPILGMPVIVGALQDKWGYTAAYAGYITSIDLAGLLLGSVVTSLMAHRVDWRWYVGGALALSAGFNLLCGPFAWHRRAVLLAVCGGPDVRRHLCLVAHAVVAKPRAGARILDHDSSAGTRQCRRARSVSGAERAFRSDRHFCGNRRRASRQRGGGSSAPRRDSPAPAAASPATARERRLILRVPLLPSLCLTAVALFYVTIGSYWAYAERMGIGFGISMQQVHWLLSAGVLLSAAGCLSARAVGHRIGQSRALLLALGMLASTLLIHGLLPTATMFIITLAVLQLCWNFIDIFQLGTLAILDPSGRAAALVPAAQGAALAAGPAAAGFVLGRGNGYTAVLLLAGFTAALAAVTYAVVHRRYRGESFAVRVS